MICCKKRRILLIFLCGICLVALKQYYLLVQVTHVRSATTTSHEDRDYMIEGPGGLTMQYRPVSEPDWGSSEKFKIPTQFRSILAIDKYIHLTPDNAADFVFATAADQTYFHVVLDAIATVQQFFPNHKIIYYDLNLVQQNPDEALKIKNLCNVVYQKFDFSKYPIHVKNLALYAWKPIIVSELLLEYSGVFWMDSSIRFLSSNFSGLYDYVIHNGGIAIFGYSGHKIFPTTHEGMYTYLPIPRNQMIRVDMYDANSVLFYRTRDVFRHIVRWWAACALEQACIASYQNRGCSFQGRDDLFAGCHRFDQSALNILMANRYGWDIWSYVYNRSRILDIRRYSFGIEQVLVCSPDGRTERIASREYSISANSQTGGISLNPLLPFTNITSRQILPVGRGIKPAGLDITPLPNLGIPGTQRPGDTNKV